MAFIHVLPILILSFAQIEGFNPKQNPANSWVYFGRGLSQREIIDLTKPKGEEKEEFLPSTTAISTAEITTTEKLLETTLESRVTTNGPSTTTVTPTTAAPVATKEIPNIRNLPESVVIIVNETTTSTLTSESPTTLPSESLEKENLVTDAPEKEVVVAVVETASTSESPLRAKIAKIVVIPKEILATTDASEVNEKNVTDSIKVTEESEILDVTTKSPLPKEAAATKVSTTSISPIKKSSKETSAASSEEEKEKSAAVVASIPSLRLVLRRIFKGE